MVIVKLVLMTTNSIFHKFGQCARIGVRFGPLFSSRESVLKDNPEVTSTTTTFMDNHTLSFIAYAVMKYNFYLGHGVISDDCGSVGKNYSTVLFLKRTWHHSYLTKKRRDMTLMIMELEMKMMMTKPLSIILVQLTNFSVFKVTYIIFFIAKHFFF